MGIGGPDPQTPGKSQTDYLAILGRITWIITKLPSQLLMFGHHLPASETPFNLNNILKSCVEKYLQMTKTHDKKDPACKESMNDYEFVICTDSHALILLAG